MARCLIGCGANAGVPRDQLERAVELLRFMPGISLVAVSRPHRSAPVGGPAGQPPFLNGACLVETALGPRELLESLAAVENTLHRDRSVRWGPRTIDLDLLLYDDLVIDEPETEIAGRHHGALTVPHPRMATRRFVLEPCAEIAPEAVHPLSGCTVRELLDNISRPALHVAVVGVPGSGAAEVAGAIADATLARLVRQPTPLPSGVDPADWDAALGDWARVLSAERAAAHGADAGNDPGPVTVVADCWLGTLLVAAEGRLSPGPRTAFADRFATRAAAALAPGVAVVTVASAATLAERIALRTRRGDHTDLFREPGVVGAGGTPESTAAELAALQQRLLERVQRRSADDDPLHRLRPPAVVVVPADDLGTAIAEGIAAVEAMT